MAIIQILEMRDSRDSTTFKSLGQKALRDESILAEAFDLIDHEEKNIRIGAMGIIREVAGQKPELVAERLDKIIDTLQQKEKPTRWIATDILACCAHLQPKKAEQAFPRIVKHVNIQEGTVLMVQTVRFLGAYGKIDPTRAEKVFPHLEKALEESPTNAIGFVLESFAEIAPLVDTNRTSKLKTIAQSYLDHATATIQKKARKLHNVLSDK